MVCIIAVSCIFYDHRFSSLACTKPGNRTVMYVCLGVFCLYQARKQNGHVCVFGGILPVPSQETERSCMCVWGYFACTKPGNRTVMYVCLGVFCLYQARKQNGHVCVFGGILPVPSQETTVMYVCLVVFCLYQARKQNGHVCVYWFGGILPVRSCMCVWFFFACTKPGNRTVMYVCLGVQNVMYACLGVQNVMYLCWGYFASVASKLQYKTSKHNVLKRTNNKR